MGESDARNESKKPLRGKELTKNARQVPHLCTLLLRVGATHQVFVRRENWAWTIIPYPVFGVFTSDGAQRSTLVVREVSRFECGRTIVS